MNSDKKYLPNISHEVKLEHIVPFTKKNIAVRFEKAKSMVVSDLLQHLLLREPLASDFKTIELVDSMEHNGDDVYYCNVKIGKLFLGGDEDMLESLLEMKNIHAFFTPEEEYVSPDEVHFNYSPKNSLGSLFGYEV